MDVGAAFRDEEFLAQKLNIHLDLWEAEKWQLEYQLSTAEKAHSRKEALQAYENAHLGVKLGLHQEELLLTNFKLESALDDVKILQTRLDVVNSHLQREKENVEKFKEQALARESYIADKQEEFARSLHDASQKHVIAEKQIQDLQLQISRMQQEHEAEMAKEKTNAADCKSKVSKELVTLIRERDFVWNQLNCMEDEYSDKLKAKEELVATARAEVENLQELQDSTQRVADERAVELTILKMELRRVEDESQEMKATISRLSARNAEEDELRQALKRLDEVRLENENLRVLYAELEAKYNNHQKPEKNTRNPKKDTTSRNLTADLDGAAGKRSSRRTRAEKENPTSDKRKRTRSESGKRRQAKERGSAVADHGIKMSFFTSSFSIPKVKRSLP